MYRLAYLCFYFCAFTLLAQDTAGVGSISGTIKGGGGAKVCAAGTSRCSVADAAGNFHIDDIRTGRYKLEITLAPRMPVNTGEVEVRAGLDTQVETALPTLDTVRESVTVSESVFVTPEEVKNSGYLVPGEEIFKSAGTLQDVSRYVQTLPGVVVGSDDFRNDIIVRGGSPLENLFVVDNIEIPNINAFANFASAGGTVSLLDAALIRDVTFLTGGYPSPYINRASSVLQVAQREGSREARAGRAFVGFGGGGLIYEGPIKKDKGSWIVSARRSFLDFFTDDVGFGGVPVLYTFNAKAVYDLSPRDRVWAVSISGVDNIRLGATKDTDPEEEISTFDINYDGWRSANGFNWQRLFGTRGVGLLGITHSEASVGSAVKDLFKSGAISGNLPVDDLIARSPLVYRERSREGESTIKYDLTAYLPMLNKLQAGGSFKIFRINYDTASPLGFDSPYSLTPALNAFSVRRDFVTTQTGAYVQSTQDFGRKLQLTWGGRFDNYAFIGQSRFSPRAGLSYRITDKLAWRTSYGMYFQQPLFLFLSVFPENRNLIPFRADHYVTGFAYTASSTLRVTLEGYMKDYKDYPVSLQWPSLSLANVGDTFAVRNILFPMASAGRGRVRGVELFVEKRFSDKWFGQFNVAYSRTRHGGLDGVLRPGSFDYPFVFNAVGGYRLTRKWELGMRAAWLSGRPYTPFDLRLSSAANRAIFDLSRVNAERLDDYFRLDIRVDRTFTVRDKPLLLFFGAQNVTNRKNPSGISWSRRLNRLEVGEQLGLFPLIGMEWRF